MEDVQTMLEQVRATIKEAAPDALETIKYGMPTFTLNGNLVYVAAHKNHIGFYATPAVNEAFSEALAPYKMGKGSIQFPFDKPLPLHLISRLVQFRAAENMSEICREKAEIAPARRKVPFVICPQTLWLRSCLN